MADVECQNEKSPEELPTRKLRHGIKHSFGKSLATTLLLGEQVLDVHGLVSHLIHKKGPLQRSNDGVNANGIHLICRYEKLRTPIPYNPARYSLMLLVS